MGKRLFFVLPMAAILIVMNSCSSYKAAFDVSQLNIERKANGYLIHFTANKPIENVEAFISQSNWLIVTIADASLDSVTIESVKPIGVIQKIETQNFGSSVQISFRLAEKFGGKVEVVHDPRSNDIFVNLRPEDDAR